MTDRILQKFKDELQKTKQDIIIAAAKFVKADLKELEQNIDFYPTADDIKDEEDLNQWIPKSLQTFLDVFISNIMFLNNNLTITKSDLAGIYPAISPAFCVSRIGLGGSSLTVNNIRSNKIVHNLHLDVCNKKERCFIYL